MRSEPGADELGHPNEKWTTGTRHAWTRVENRELQEAAALKTGDRAGYNISASQDVGSEGEMSLSSPLIQVPQYHTPQPLRAECKSS